MATDTWMTDASSLSNMVHFPTRWTSASHTQTTTPSPDCDTMNSYPSPIIQAASIMERAPAHPRYSSRAYRNNRCNHTVISSINVGVFALKNHHYHLSNSIYTNTLVTTCVNCGYRTTISHVDATDDTDIPSLPYDLRDDEVAPIYLARKRQAADSGGIEMASGGIGGRPSVPRQQSLGEPQSSTGQPTHTMED